MSNFLPYSAGSLALVSSALVAAPTAANTATIAPLSPLVSRSPATVIAQVDTCRRVPAGISGLNVRQSPTTTAAIVGVIPGGQTVDIETVGADGWVPISEPMAGYVSSNYLTLCDDVAEPMAAVPVAPAVGEQCRQVVVPSGLNVRVAPDRYSNRLTALPMGTNIELAETETDNWVEIMSPVEGYVAKRFLGPCLD